MLHVPSHHVARWPLLVFFTVSGVAGVVYGLISEEWPLTLLSVGLTGRMMVSAAYYICLQVWRVFSKYNEVGSSFAYSYEHLKNGVYLQYGSEIFPTVIRGQGVALCEIVGGVAIFVSPLVVYLVG